MGSSPRAIAQSDCTPNAPVFVPRGNGTPQPTLTPSSYDPCAPTGTLSPSPSRTYIQSTLLPQPVFVETGSVNDGVGLFGAYYDSNIIYLTTPTPTTQTTQVLFTHTPFATFIESRVDKGNNGVFRYVWGATPPVNGVDKDFYAVRWTGAVVPKQSGNYWFQACADDDVRLWVNGILVGDDWNGQALPCVGQSTHFTLAAGQLYPIAMEYRQTTAFGAEIHLKWAFSVDATQPAESAFVSLPVKQLYPELYQDIVSVYRPSERTFHLHYQNRSEVGQDSIHLAYANTADMPVVGDWDGDGFTDVGVFRSESNGTGRFLLTTSKSATVSSAEYDFVYGNAGDIPLAGRWNPTQTGDGIGVFRVVNGVGVFQLRNALSSGAYNHEIAFGTTGDLPLVADWNADGIDTPGVFRRGDGLFFLQDALSTGGQTGYVAFGGDNSDQPVSGDWNIDGQDSVGVYRLNVNESGINAVYLSNDVSGNGEVDLFFTYGVAGNPPSVPADIPVVGRWQQPGCPSGYGQGGGAIACAQITATPLPTFTSTPVPPLPTNTPRPTTGPTPTATLTPIPLCFVTVNPNQTLRVREQPSRDPKNTLFILSSDGSLGSVLPFDDPLWNGSFIQAGEVVSLNVIARVGIISWVSPSADWYQVQIIKDNAIAVRTAYIGIDAGNATACPGASIYPLPTPDPSMPILPAPAFLSGISLSHVFGQQPSAYMGVCGFHGTSCGTQGSTFDVVPRNVEYCVDTRANSLASECDQATNGQIPVYAPASGQVRFYESGAVVAIDVDDGIALTGNPGPREIAFVHLDKTNRPPNVSNGASITAGSLIGYLCSNGNFDTKATNCGIDDPNTPTHLAISLRYIDPNAQNGIRSPTNVSDTLRMLAHPSLPPPCSYDDWLGQNGNPVRQTIDTYRGCP